VQLRKERSISGMAFDFWRLRNQCNGISQQKILELLQEIYE
jgi:hypothetical protein